MVDSPLLQNLKNTLMVCSMQHYKQSKRERQTERQRERESERDRERQGEKERERNRYRAVWK